MVISNLFIITLIYAYNIIIYTTNIFILGLLHLYVARILYVMFYIDYFIASLHLNNIEHIKTFCSFI